MWVALEPGTYTLGAAPPGRAPMLAGTTSLSHGSEVTLDYRSRAPVRVGGWVVFLGGTAAGLALMLTSIEDDGSLGSGFVAGAVLNGVSLLAGLLMMRAPDQAELRTSR